MGPRNNEKNRARRLSLRGAAGLLALSLILVGGTAHAQLLTGVSENPSQPSMNGDEIVAQPLLTPVAATSASASRAESDSVDVDLDSLGASSIKPSSLEKQKAQKSARAKQSSAQKDTQQPVDLTADKMQHDNATDTITASGNVILKQAGRTLKADEVRYLMKQDKVIAKGHVVLLDKNGDTHTADYAELDNAMKEGFVRGVQSYLAEGGIFKAKDAQRKPNEIVMTDASYTPCDCEGDSEGNPAWQVRADKLVYNEKEHRVSYRDATFDIYGVPVLWTPYLSHSDGQIKRKSGFLTPSLGYKSDLGLIATERYYWDIAPNKDATFGTMLTSQNAPVALAQYRQRFTKAKIELNGSLTYSDRYDQIGTRSVPVKNQWRGHLFADGLWDINNKWRAGAKVQVTSDNQYLRQYDFSTRDVLENEVYAERFSGRNYAVGRLLAFQDTRVGDSKTDQPNVLPEIFASFYGKPNDTMGGRWKVETSGLGLRRESGGQDMQRLVVKTNWERRFVSDTGLLTTADLNLRGSLYHVTDREGTAAIAQGGNSGNESRAFAQAYVVSSYPMVKNYENMQAVIAPKVGIALAPQINADSAKIPNEDSQDVQIDASNVFNANRFPGDDRIDDGSRLTYGVESGLYAYDGSSVSAFIGQSHRFDRDGNPFPYGSGLSRRTSDLVGQVSGKYKKRYGFNYRFQISSKDMSSQRQEFDGYANWGRFNVNSRYLFAKALEGTDISESREQLDTGAGVYLTRNWRLRGHGLYDLGKDPGLRQAAVGLDYFGCCMSFSVNATRNLTTDSSGDNGTDITFRIGLKNIGEFQQADPNAFDMTSDSNSGN